MTHASVFSGIGGPEVAATMLGWQNLFHCEINPFGRAVLDYWYPNSKSYEDIKKTDFTEWRGRVDVLTGGFPCQPFSCAGKRRGAEDDRYLWPYMFRCIDQVRPTWIVAENVAGILTMVEQGEVSKVAGTAPLFAEIDDLRGLYELCETFTLQRICTDLEGRGYTVQPVLVPACAVGAPHRRDRVFIVARRIEAIERLQPEQPETSRAAQEQSGEGSGEDGDARPSAYNDSEGLERRHDRHPSGSAAAADRPVGLMYQDNGVAGCSRWDTFPSVSPVHRGYDGLPFPVDHLTIPFAKWRTESLKAYGNAIVPQVMYEIFRAIEQVEMFDSKYNYDL